MSWDFEPFSEEVHNLLAPATCGAHREFAMGDR
jgi:hypothetical protein